MQVGRKPEVALHSHAVEKRTRESLHWREGMISQSWQFAGFTAERWTQFIHPVSQIAGMRIVLGVP